MNLAKFPWRVGTKTRRTIYAVVPDLDMEEHPLLGMMDTPDLALEAVNSHNEQFEKLANSNSGWKSYTFAEKEQLISDLKQTFDLWTVNPNLEKAILQVTNRRKTRAERVYQAIGISSDILGQEAGIPKIIDNAIDLIRNH